MNPIRKALRSVFPVMDWGSRYSPKDFQSDSIAGLVVLFITVPQVIAYAFLAGMPAETGLYAAICALLGYALFGSSRALAVGPAAIMSMMTLEAVSAYAQPGTTEYAAIVVQLCMVTGIVLIVLRIVNFGSVISFLSHAVVTGFITAAAILIISNQIPSIIGISSSADTSILGVFKHIATEIPNSNKVVLAVSAGAIAVLLFCKSMFGRLLREAGVKASIVDPLVKSAPMYVVVLGVLIVRILNLDSSADVPVVGDIPGHLPEFQLVLFGLDRFQELLPSALLIAMVIFMESTSVGTAIASKCREKINANQELVGLGAANIGAALVGGFPVAGSFGRSVVNFSSGAVSPVASVVTAVLLIVTLMLFAPAFYYLPKGVLSAIIVIAAWQLIDLQVIRKIFTFNPTDAVTFSFTFLAVLGFGVESGVLVGIAISFVLLIRSSSKPHIAIVGRVGDSEHFRNIERHDVKTFPSILALRVDESLYFVNTRYIESFVLDRVAESHEIEHVLLICTATNFIDTSGLDMLEELSANLQEAGVTLHLAEVKGPVMDRLKETSFYKEMKGQVFFTTDIAMKTLVASLKVVQKASD